MPIQVSGAVLLKCCSVHSVAYQFKGNGWSVEHDALHMFCPYNTSPQGEELG